MDAERDRQCPAAIISRSSQYLRRFIVVARLRSVGAPRGTYSQNRFFQREQDRYRRGTINPKGVATIWDGSIILGVNEELKRQISDRITVFLESRSPEPTMLKEPFDSKLHAAVSKLNVLPLFLDMGGCYAITEDGEIISFAWDREMDIQVERDERIRNIALFQGSKQYPELEVLIPTRPVDAPDCQTCHGTGKPPILEELKASKGLDTVLCYCGGLGWLPAGDDGSL